MLFQWLKKLHISLILATLGLILVGTLFIHSASSHAAHSFLMRQLLWAGVGIVVLLLIPALGYRTLLSLSSMFYLGAVILLLWVLVGGESRLGAARWIRLGPLLLQPSEFAKLATVILLASYLGERQPFEAQARTITVASLIALLPFLLIAKQPDLGSALVFIPLLLGLLFLWGVRKRFFIFSAVSGVLAAPVFWHFLKPYQKKRLLVFLDPTQDPLGSGYTALQSRIAVGSGGLFGKGYLAGTQSQLDFVPEHHTDFIFCVLGEEWGFLGSLLLLGLYVFLFHSAFQIMEQTTDIKAKLLIGGVVSILFTQVFINIGMSIGLMPITGITLPLISYGGSSLIATAFGLGMILSIYKERSIF